MLLQPAWNRPRLISALCALATVLTFGGLSTLTGCRPGVPIIATAPKPAQPIATISGTVRGPGGAGSPQAIGGRTVEAIDVDTGERQRETTSPTGGFTFKLKPGKYRVELTLRPGESLTTQPVVVELTKSDVDAHADFVLGNVRSSRPSDPSSSSGSALGPPIA